jgi:glyoxylase-like metal-dependent hydrolase (beta-lactamase superfamily II)
MEQVHERIWRVPSEHVPGRFTNVYIVRGGTRTAMIDTGVLGTPTRDVTPVLDGLGLALSDIDQVVNTHGHYDHMGGNAEMADAGAPIALHGHDLWRAESNEAQGREVREMFETIGYPDEGEPLEASVLGLLGREVGVERLLEDGDRVDLGGGVELLVVHTPGHTVGSVSLLWEAEGVLVTGDSFQGRYPNRVPILQDPEYYAASIDRVEELDVRLLLAGHNFHGTQGEVGPTVRGSEAVGQLLSASREAYETLSTAFREALSANPEASDAELAALAIEGSRSASWLGTPDGDGTSTPDLVRGGHRTLPSFIRMTRDAAETN